MFAQTVFTHKVHEGACERNNKKENFLEWTSVVFVFFTLVSLVLDLTYFQEFKFSYLGISLTITELTLQITGKTFQFGEKAICHKNTAQKFLHLRNDYLSLIADIMNNQSTQEVKIRRNELINRYNEICDLSPQTESSNYEYAQKKLQTKSEQGKGHYSWTEEEIDSFLPKELKLKHISK